MGNCAPRKETEKKSKKHEPKPRANAKKNTPLPSIPENSKKSESCKKSKEERKKADKKLVEKDKSSNKEKKDRSEYPKVEDDEEHCDKNSQEPFLTPSVTNGYENLYTSKRKILDDVEPVWSVSVIVLIVIIMYLLEKLIS